MGDRGSGYKAATNIDKNIVEYFFDFRGCQFLVPKLGFAIIILPLMPQGEVATEENQAFEMTVSGKNHQR